MAAWKIGDRVDQSTLTVPMVRDGVRRLKDRDGDLWEFRLSKDGVEGRFVCECCGDESWANIPQDNRPSEMYSPYEVAEVVRTYREGELINAGTFRELAAQGITAIEDPEGDGYRIKLTKSGKVKYRRTWGRLGVTEDWVKAGPKHTPPDLYGPYRVTGTRADLGPRFPVGYVFRNPEWPDSSEIQADGVTEVRNSLGFKVHPGVMMSDFYPYEVVTR